MESDDEPLDNMDVLSWLTEFQRVDNSDDTSEVLAAADEYFNIQQEE